MSDNIMKLVPERKAQANEACVKMLEDMLDYAREGKIVAGACCFETFDNTTITIVSEGGKFHLIMAGLESLKYKILKDHTETKPFTNQPV